MRLRATLAVALLSAVVGCHSKAGEHKRDPGFVRLQKRVAAFDRRLAVIQRAVADAARVEDQACPDAAIDKQLHGSTGSVLLADYAFLGRFAGKPPVAQQGRFKSLTTPALRDVALPADLHTQKQATDALWKIQKLQRDHPYLAVLRASHRELPHMEGKRFHPGVLSGGLFVFDLSTGKQLCRARVDAHSSEQVAGMKGQDRAQALQNDFSLRLRQELDRALSRVSQQLELDFD